jgi:mRNA interferase MazF
VGPGNGLAEPSVVSCDHIITIDKASLGRHLGFLFERQESELAAAIISAFALRAEDPPDRTARRLRGEAGRSALSTN